jgi:hypothetical protein
MAQAEISAGICGFVTIVEARMEGEKCALRITSGCKAIQRLAAELHEVDPLQEFTLRGAGPDTLRLAAQYCAHAACPVPVGIIKAIEVAAGLALPADVTIKLTR